MPYSQGLSNNLYPKPNQAQFFELIHISLRSILILSSHLCLGLSKGLFPVGVPINILKALLSGYVNCPSQSSRFNHPDYSRGMVHIMKFLIVKPSPLPIHIRRA